MNDQEFCQFVRVCHRAIDDARYAVDVLLDTPEVYIADYFAKIVNELDIKTEFILLELSNRSAKKDKAALEHNEAIKEKILTDRQELVEEIELVRDKCLDKSTASDVFERVGRELAAYKKRRAAARSDDDDRVHVLYCLEHELNFLQAKAVEIRKVLLLDKSYSLSESLVEIRRQSSSSSSNEEEEQRPMPLMPYRIKLEDCRFVDFYATSKWSPEVNPLGRDYLEFARLNNVDDVETTQCLNLANREITHVEPKCFHGLSTLIECCWKEFKQGDDGTLPIELKHIVKLETLSLSLNSLTKLHDLTFHGLSNLHSLDLSNNSLLVLEPHSLDSLSSLETLNLKRNQLTLVGPSPSPFLPLKSLKELDLSHNRLHRLTGSMFRSLGDLRVLRLDNNQLESIETKAFWELAALETLLLNSNSLRTLDDEEGCVFLPLINLKGLVLSHNYLESIDALRCLNKLERLLLSNNRLEKSVDEALGFLCNLKRLDLSMNQLAEMPSQQVLRKLGGLKELNVSSNEIAEIRGSSKDFKSGLKRLDLSKNRLETIHYNAFKGLTQLEHLYLGGNNIRSIEPKEFYSMKERYPLCDNVAHLDNMLLLVSPTAATN